MYTSVYLSYYKKQNLISSLDPSSILFLFLLTREKHWFVFSLFSCFPEVIVYMTL